MNVKNAAYALMQRHKTNDPFEIAAAQDIQIINAMLGQKVRGFCHYCLRRYIIYLNSDLSDHERRFVCAHELGHIFLHKNLNSAFLNTYTLSCTSKYENEAHLFALELLYGYMDPEEFDGWSQEAIQGFLGINQEIYDLWIRYRNKKGRQLKIKWQ